MDALDTASLLFSFPDDIVISLIRATTSEVVLHIASRRPCATCPLCEQPSERVQSYARMTNRLRAALLALGLATGAQVSERLVPSLGMQVSAPTLLRHLRLVA